MLINPSYTAVGKLFEHQPIFFIPKYQRSYSWSMDSVGDFIKDFHECCECRLVDTPKNHFFGGILTVQHDVPGAVNQHKYEVIDGQQRLATMTLFVSCVIQKYKILVLEAEGDQKDILQNRVWRLSKRFLNFRQEVNMEEQNVDTLTLSKADSVYFRQLINGQEPEPERNSHRLLGNAYSKLTEMVDGLVDAQNGILEKAKVLECMSNVLDQDFTVLHMVTKTSPDAYRLFQVINDRGTSLTDGDLLRAKTLELLEQFPEDQVVVEQSWDDILCDEPGETERYLGWIYESYTGKRPKPNALFDNYLDYFFQGHDALPLQQADADRIRLAVIQTKKDINSCKQIYAGQWPYQHQQPVTAWDRTRLSLLISELNHTLSIPLLLAAKKLDHKEFSKIVQNIEIVFFRFKMICNQHVNPLKKIYSDEAVSIRQNPEAYDCQTLNTKLETLIAEKAGDETFSAGLKTLKYSKKGGSNKPLKYFLMTLEYYYSWYLAGHQGPKVCLDKARVYDFAGTSIEHIYPQSADEADFDDELEIRKNDLGNLIILDPTQNSVGGNDSFEEKKVIYSQSSVEITKVIGAFGEWDLAAHNDHFEKMKNVALEVFKVQ